MTTKVGTCDKDAHVTTRDKAQLPANADNRNRSCKNSDNHNNLITTQPEQWTNAANRNRSCKNSDYHNIKLITTKPEQRTNGRTRVRVQANA